MSAGWLKKRWRTPDYLQPDRDPDAPRRGLADMVRDHKVRRGHGSGAAMRAAFLQQVQPDEEANH